MRELVNGSWWVAAIVFCIWHRVDNVDALPISGRLSGNLGVRRVDSRHVDHHCRASVADAYEVLALAVFMAVKCIGLRVCSP